MKEANTEKRIPWHIIGPIIALSGLAFAIYSSYSNKQYSQITFQELSSNSVIEISERIPELKIYYEDKDLTNTDEEIIIYEYRVQNTGTTDIKQVDYDTSNDWGIQISQCTLLSHPELKSASNKYIENNFDEMHIDSLGRIVFTKSLFDSQEYFDIRLLTLKNKDSNPSVKLFGKISGIKDWNYLKANEKQDEFRSQPKIFRNTVLNIITLLTTLIILFYLLIKLISMLWRKIMKRVASGFFKSRISDFRKHKDYNDNEFHEFVYEMYKNHGESFLQMAKDLLAGKEKDLLRDLIYINELEKQKLEKFKDNLITNMNVAQGRRLKQYIQSFPRNNDLLEVMTRHSFLLIEKVDDGEIPFKVMINESLIEALEEFLHFLSYQR